MLTVSKAGPLGTDVELTWTGSGQASYTIYRAETALGVTRQEALDVTQDLSYRDETAAGFGSPPALFYLVQ